MKARLARAFVGISRLWRGRWFDLLLLTAVLFIAIANAAPQSALALLMLLTCGTALAGRILRLYRNPSSTPPNEDLKRNALLNRALNSMSQGLCMFDADKRLIVCNERYADLYRMPRKLMAPGTHFKAIVESRIASGLFAVGNPTDYVRERLAAVEERVPSVKIQELMDGRIIAISHRPTPEGGWVATHDDITEIRRIEAQMTHLAHHDALTGLPNRLRFQTELDRVLAENRRGSSLAVLCLDLDRFKAVNDSLGHPVGDALLKAVTGRLYAEVREADVLARLGGDEFAVVQTDVKTPAEVSAFAQRLIDELGKPYEIDGHLVVVGTSVGIALAPADGSDADQLLKAADMALYLSKQEGRGVYRFFEPEMDAKMQARRALELALRQALKNHEFELYYQPLVSAKGEGIVAFEALLRWHHPERGLVPPSEFIPLAEEIGLIGDIGAWVLREACREAATWPDQIHLSVNLSPAQFKRPTLVLDVLTALGQSGLPASRLELEITETVMLQDTQAAISTLIELHKQGIGISLDDFGTGYSSLSYLRKFPFDKIKIDRSFVQSLPQDRGSAAIIKAMVALGNDLGMSITAEGVENSAQLTRVIEEGCGELQGFFFSQPRPVSDIRHLLMSRDERVKSSAA
jgi:diguanylate cyclase (GGDEF)-like protein